jgi:ribonuclease HI
MCGLPKVGVDGRQHRRSLAPARCTRFRQENIAVMWRAKPDIAIEILWRPAHKDLPGNEKADEWAKLAAEEPEAGRVQWLGG